MDIRFAGSNAIIFNNKSRPTLSNCLKCKQGSTALNLGNVGFMSGSLARLTYMY